MPAPGGTKPSLKRRLKIVTLSLLGLIAPALACVPCPTACYAPLPSTTTPTPFVTCYVAPPPTATPPTSPLPTPTPTPEARQQLLDRLLAEGRLPEAAARTLES